MRPRARAASVPTLTATCQSARAAVGLRRGSMTTRAAPAARARATTGQRWTLVVRRSAPHAMMRSDSAALSGSAPPTLPSAASQPASAHDGLPAFDDLAERLLPRDRSEAALALPARPAQRRPDPIGGVHQLVVVVDLRAGEPGSERVSRVALDADDAPVVDVGDQRALVGAVVGADGADGPGHGDPEGIKAPAAGKAGADPACTFGFTPREFTSQPGDWRELRGP